MAECVNDKFPVSIITLQETHLLPNTDVNFFQLPGYTLVYDFARINTFGGVAIYVHDSFSFESLDIELFHQNSTVFESILLKVCNNHCKHQSHVIGSIYRRPSDLIADLTQFTDEFSVILSNVHAMCNQAYMNGDYIINLLLLHTNNHYDAFHENVTSQGFFLKISRPTRSFENSQFD